MIDRLSRHSSLEFISVTLATSTPTTGVGMMEVSRRRQLIFPYPRFQDKNECLTPNQTYIPYAFLDYEFLSFEKKKPAFQSHRESREFSVS
jgi:hypothetical protein